MAITRQHGKLTCGESHLHRRKKDSITIKWPDRNVTWYSSDLLVLQPNALAGTTRRGSQKSRKYGFLLRYIIQATEEVAARWHYHSQIFSFCLRDCDPARVVARRSSGGRDRMRVFLGAISFCPKTNFWRISTVSCDYERPSPPPRRHRTANKFSNDETVSVRRSVERRPTTL